MMQSTSPSPETGARVASRSSPRKPSLSTRVSGGLSTQTTAGARLEPLSVPDTPFAASASGSPVLARSLSRPKKDGFSGSPISYGPASTSLPRPLKLTPSPSPPPSLPLEHSAAAERQQALERKAALLTAQIRSRQQQQHQTNQGPMLAPMAVSGTAATACSTPQGDELAPSELASSSSNVLTLDPTLHQVGHGRPTSGSVHSVTSRLSDDTTHHSLAAATASGNTDALTPFHGNVLTDELLRDWTGWENLPLVLSAEFRVDATKMIGLDQLGAKLPRLASLKLSKSRIPQVRLLGTKFTQLKYLWLNNCRLEGLRGIGSAVPRLEELYASFNHLTDLSPLLDVSETLRVLDVEGNDIADVKMLSMVLPSLRSVTALTLQLNPVEAAPEVQARLKEMQAADSPTNSEPNASKSQDNDGDGDDDLGTGSTSDDDDETAGERQLFALRAWIGRLMPQLEYLDDIGMQNTTSSDADDACAATPSPDCQSPAPTDSAVARQSSPRCRGSPAAARAKIRSTFVDPMNHALAEELRLVRECIRESEFDALEEKLEAINSVVYSRPATSCAGAVPRSRPGSRACATSSGRLGPSAGRLGSASAPTAGTSADPAVSSLTTGDVCVGSAIASLRRRLSPAVTPVQQTVTPPRPSSGRRSASLASSSGEASPLRPPGTSSASQHALSADRDGALPGGTRLDNVALFDDDDEDDVTSWERFKSALLADDGYRRRPASRRPGASPAAQDAVGASVSSLPSRSGLAAATSTARSSSEDDAQQQRYQQLKLRMAAASASPTDGVTATLAAVLTDNNEDCADATKPVGVDSDQTVRSAAAAQDEDPILTAGLSRPTSETQTVRISSASLSQQRMLSALGGTTTARPPRASLRVAPMSGSARRMSLPRSAGSQGRPASGEKSVGHDDSDDGFESTLKSELLHARAQLARSHAPYAGEDIMPDE